MLDDLKLIAARDKSDALGVAEKQISQLDYEFDVDFEPKGDVRNVVLAGMGGSALYGEILRSWPGLSVPFEIVRGYEIPGYVNENTLFISSSFSGNTEEALEALSRAETADAQIAVISAGGKLSEIAAEKNYPLASLDSSIPQPRMSALNAFKALLTILQQAGLYENRVEELVNAGQNLKDISKDWRPDVPAKNNLAKQLAEEVMGRSMVVYSGRKLFPVANKWKINFNENAKNVAWLNYYPELNHNEFIGWSSHPVEKPYAVINIKSNLEHERIGKRFEISDKLLSGRRPAPIDVEMQGGSLIEQIIYGIVLGDFVTIYVAILNNVDPSPVELVERLKAELKK